LNLRERYLKGRPPKSRMISEDPETGAVGLETDARPRGIQLAILVKS